MHSPNKRCGACGAIAVITSMRLTAALLKSIFYATPIHLA